MNIDATKVGNVARFFNHRYGKLQRSLVMSVQSSQMYAALQRSVFCCSCDGGNLRLEVIRPQGHPLPHIAMFASRHISKGEELTFSYGQMPTDSQMPAAVQLNVPGDSSTLGVDEQDSRQRRRRCFCKSSSCSGFLPGSW